MAIHEAITSGLDRQKVVALTPEVVRLPKPPAEILDLWFGRAREKGYIALGSRRRKLKEPDGEPFPHFFTVLPVGDLQLIFPEFITQQLQNTKYIGTNTMKSSVLKVYGKKEKTEEQFIQAVKTGVPEYYQFTNDNVRELVTIFADLDVGRDGMFSAKDAVVSLFAKAVFGHIPQPSMIAESGRGAYAIWLLRESEFSQAPPLVTHENKHRWKLVTNELLGKISDLFPDHNAKRLAQWVKAPGTTDTKTGNKVTYFVFHSGDESSPTHIPLYTLDELTEFLDIPTADIDEPVKIGDYQKWKGTPTPALPAVKKPKHGGTSKAQAPMRARMRDLEYLAQARRGYQAGFRFSACSYYCWAVWSCYAVTHESKEAWVRARERLHDFNKRWCVPPLPMSELQKVLGGKYRPKVRYQTIVDDLKIEWEEAEELELRQLIPKRLRDRREGEKKRKRKGRKSRKDTIDDLILAGKTNKQIYRLTSRHNPPVRRDYVCRARQRLGIPDPAVKSEKQESIK